MQYKQGLRKNRALKVLDLDLDASEAQILKRIDELIKKYEASENPEDHAKLKKAYDATSILLEEEGRPLFPREIRKRRLKIGGMGSVLLLLIIVASIFTGVSINRQNTYDELQTMMKDVSIVNYESMGELVEKLPESYKNMASIKEEYALVRRSINTIEDNNVFEKTSVMRVSFYDLKALDESTDDWDLSYYLSRVDRRVLLLNARWENDEVHFNLKKMSDAEIGTSLDTSLPNEMESHKNYDIYTRYNARIFGYVEYPDRSNAFQAYEILSITENEIEILAFTNNETYTMQLVD